MTGEGSMAKNLLSIPSTMILGSHHLELQFKDISHLLVSVDTNMQQIKTHKQFLYKNKRINIL